MQTKNKTEHVVAKPNFVFIIEDVYSLPNGVFEK